MRKWKKLQNLNREFSNIRWLTNKAIAIQIKTELQLKIMNFSKFKINVHIVCRQT